MSSYSTDFASYVVGMIKYQGSEPLVDYDIAVDLEDANKNVLASENAFTKPSIVKPGGLIPYKAMFSDAPEYEYYHTYIQSQGASDFLLNSYTADFYSRL